MRSVGRYRGALGSILFFGLNDVLLNFLSNIYLLRFFWKTQSWRRIGSWSLWLVCPRRLLSLNIDRSDLVRRLRRCYTGDISCLLSLYGILDLFEKVVPTSSTLDLLFDFIPQLLLIYFLCFCFLYLYLFVFLVLILLNDDLLDKKVKVTLKFNDASFGVYKVFCSLIDLFIWGILRYEHINSFTLLLWWTLLDFLQWDCQLYHVALIHLGTQVRGRWLVVLWLHC